MKAEEQFVHSSGGLLLGVMGDPIAHSKSPQMHGAALQALGITGAYVPLHIASERLGDAISAIRTLGFRGVNVTIPHKVAVMEFLDQLDESAASIGAVNTIVNDGGRLTGYNTDGIGYVRSLKAEAAPELQDTRILVLGAGGAARGIIHSLLKERPAELIVANRTPDKAVQLAEEWSTLGPIRGIGLEEAPSFIEGTDLVINTTSIGMHPKVDGTPFSADLLAPGMVVSDLIYNPLETRLLREARERGCTAHGGLGMFVYQGAYALEYWTGRPAPVDAMRQAMLECMGS